MSALCLFLLPGHAYERPLHVVVDHLGPPTRPLLHLFLVRWVALDSESDLLQTPLLEHLLGHIAVLYVLEEPVHGSTVYSWKKENQSSSHSPLGTKVSAR